MDRNSDFHLRNLNQGLKLTRVSQHRSSSSVSKPLLPDEDDDSITPSHRGNELKPHGSFAEKWVPLALQPYCDWLFQLLPQGWRFSASLGVLLSSTVLLINILVAAWSFTVMRDHKADLVSAPVATGDCRDIEWWGSLIHLAINAASTLLLGASSSAMQILCAPSRKNVDEAHRRGSWLDIGVLSLRNVMSMSVSKFLLWVLLGLSSVPLHLVYNSTFFVSTINHHYDVYVASAQFTDGADFDSFIGKYDQEPYYANYSWTDLPVGSNPLEFQAAVVQNSSTGGGTFERLEKEDCMRSYSEIILPSRRNVILVTKTKPRDNVQLHGIVNFTQTELPEPNTISCNESSQGHILTSELGPVTCMTNSTLYGIAHYAMPVIGVKPPFYANWYYWMCSQKGYYYSGDRIETDDGRSIEMPQFLQPPGKFCSDGLWEDLVAGDNWSVYGFDVEYCLSEKLSGQCSLNVATSLLLVVIIFNIVKVAVIVATLFTITDKPLITIGDSIASFIEEEDIYTRGMCLLGKEDVIHHMGDGKSGTDGQLARLSTRQPSRSTFQLLFPKPFQPQSLHWFRAASTARWSTCLSL
ncbi:hypothetical protein MPH_13175 [Macrophomina phaseolina MS6]|uniref:DUF6536 domain-containing protein n=1 Tax=Macrophomina phaseolina (strain MS6) TaxID=1126212 RepID=K2RA51_MACPH|nr:hypothetical protein MPH_13175 [Macrophomina phaseolina MS6]